MRLDISPAIAQPPPQPPPPLSDYRLSGRQRERGCKSGGKLRVGQPGGGTGVRVGRAAAAVDGGGGGGGVGGGWGGWGLGEGGGEGGEGGVGEVDAGGDYINNQ